MNQDTIWQAMRYALLLGGGFFVGRGTISAEQLELIAGLAGAIVSASWGFWVKWNTTPVLDKIIIRNAIPAVDGATGGTKRLMP